MNLRVSKMVNIIKKMMKNKSLLDEYIESLSYDDLMEYLGTQGLRGITLPVYEGKTRY